MVSKNLKSIAKKIKALEIQGASRVRAAFVKAIRDEANKSKAKSVVEFRKEIREGMRLLLAARPTEPETRTAARIILKKLNVETKNVEELRQIVTATCKNYEADRKNAMMRITNFGSKLIRKGDVVFTHCHSHTVMDILTAAKKKIKYVICTETRPMFQGRRTAKDLTNAGIETTMIVDSAASSFIKKADLFITGCDAILTDGSIVNKIGTRQISMVARYYNVPHVVAGSSHKFDPVTYYGMGEEIEERPPSEVWERKLKHLTIKNPAFDITQAIYIQDIITELGIFRTESFAALMHEILDLKNKKLRDFNLEHLFKK